MADIVDPDECPIKQVDLTVPKTDDPTLPVYTFRMWFLGILSCSLLSFVNQFFWYRDTSLLITSIPIQIAVLPIARLMARTITDRVFWKGTRFEFTLNPGPFNVKEHVMITILANAGAGTVYATHILSAVKLFYKRSFGFVPALFIMMTTQMLGYGWAGIFRKYLVEPGEMWWPNNLVQVSLFRAMHEKEKKSKGGSSRMQFFLIVLVCSFSYYVIPNSLFTNLTSINWLCWINPKSMLLSQLGSGKTGLGIGVIGLDWATISSLGSPLASPWFATANTGVGFFIVAYVIIPIGYWFNFYKAKNFPIISQGLYQLNGLRELWNLTKSSFKKNKKEDIHTRLMGVYKEVPMWWFLVILVINIALMFYACLRYKSTLQLPWWGCLLAIVISFVFTLPIGIIYATTNQQPGLNIITEYIIGYAYPGWPVANMLFKVYGYISMSQAHTFLADFKLGHYMKIPPRAMFCAQVVGTIISVFVYLLTAWWLMEAIPNLCDTDLLPPGSPWTCRGDHTFYSASVLWGLVGPKRIFGTLGVYPALNWFFLGGAIAPLLVWAAAKKFPKQKWISLINMPVLFSAVAGMPPNYPVNYTSWILVAFISGYVLYKHKPKWWERYNYVLSGGLDAGLAFSAVLMFFALPNAADWWGNREDGGCPLATCPTAKGIKVTGCPVF